SPGDPDRFHLHSLIATNVVHPRLPRLAPNLRNAAVSVLMWICAVLPVIPAVLFPTQGELLLGVLAGCFAAYHFYYRFVASLAGGRTEQEQAASARPS
ncbi:MAG TPA: glycosyl transferase, partial [Ramlibacter sp.]